MRRAAVDASVVLARLRHEPRPAWVDRAIDDAVLGRSELVAPTLLWIEVGNRLVRRGTSDERALEGMLRVDTIGIEAIELSRPLRLRALQLAREHQLTIYDATYLAVAETVNVPLLTLDERLEQAAVAMGLGREGASSQVSDRRAGLEATDVDTDSLAAIGAALAEMRRELVTG